MINSVNGLDILKPKLLTMDKYNSTTTTKLLPSSSFTQTRTFVQIGGHQNNKNAIDSQSDLLLNKELKHHQERVRVQHLENPTKLQNNKCWNNFRTLCNIQSASSDYSGKEMFQIRQTNDSSKADVVNIVNEESNLTKITPINKQNKSAFNLEIIKKLHNNNNNGNGIGCYNRNIINNNLKIDSPRASEANNSNVYNKIYCKQYNNYGLMNKQPTATTLKTVMSTREPQPIAAITTTITSQRTEDQNDAYRHIESVHNYAKSKSFEGDDEDNTSPNGSRHSSYLDDDDDEDDEDEDNGEDDDIDYENGLRANVDEIPYDLDADYEDIFYKERYRKFQKLSTSSDGALAVETKTLLPSRFGNILKNQQIQQTRVNNSKIIQAIKEEEDGQTDIDVETVESHMSPTIPISDTMNSLAVTNGDIKPDHHARRPMNAFLIFCKRHRAIVKERYKNLENRAITKILGDWWASLDTNDKKCFTNLAQENKDAFFSANPNFKWYKLPAPPLRTLSTRPAIASGQEFQDDNEANTLETISNNITHCSNNPRNYFKLADEAQMGDLSQLMQDKSNAIKEECTDLQQVLGEASQFMSAHITGNSESPEENHLKRRFYSENSVSSNSSEDDAEPKKKNARSCKGKRYQELINSGQIATALKKSKSLTPRSIGGGANADDPEIDTKNSFQNISNFNGNNNLNNNNNNKNGCLNRSVSESENVISCDLNGFDLEERIKELPALNLDDYLQRKRNTKKKKKFSSSGKKRGQRSHTSVNNKTNSSDAKPQQQQQQIQLLATQPQHHQQQQATTAVGSQKRKARKESITRRNVKEIEQEVASLLPLTINGCCYFQEAPTVIKYSKIQKDIAANDETPQSLNVVTTSTIIPLKQETLSSPSEAIKEENNTNTPSGSGIISNDTMSSSTSDLLILAEVAANRTELYNISLN